MPIIVIIIIIIVVKIFSSIFLENKYIIKN